MIFISTGKQKQFVTKSNFKCPVTQLAETINQTSCKWALRNTQDHSIVPKGQVSTLVRLWRGMSWYFIFALQENYSNLFREFIHLYSSLNIQTVFQRESQHKILWKLDYLPNRYFHTTNGHKHNFKEISKRCKLLQHKWGASS